MCCAAAVMFLAGHRRSQPGAGLKHHFVGGEAHFAAMKHLGKRWVFLRGEFYVFAIRRLRVGFWMYDLPWLRVCQRALASWGWCGRV